MAVRLFNLVKSRRPDYMAPADARIYAIGDIHGRLDLLAELHRRIAADALANPARRKVVVYIGDYVDRGLHSRAVIDHLLDQPLGGFESVHLKGNHEAMMLEFIRDARAASGWLEIGGNATLLSYGVKLREDLGLADRLVAAQEQLEKKLPPRHYEFLSNLKLHHREGGYLFVHAGLRPRVPLEEQNERDLLWIRDAFLESAADHGSLVVHGHSISWQPEIKDNRINIDTGAFASGILTSVVLEGATRSFIQTSR